VSGTVVHDTTIVTGDAAGTILHDAALAVVGDRIAALGPSADVLARHPEAERVNGRARAVFPGLVNAHTHFSRVLDRGIAEDLSPPHTPPFTGGLSPLPSPALSPHEERVMILLGALEAIRSGTTLALQEGSRIDGYGCCCASARGTAAAPPSARLGPSSSTARSARRGWSASPPCTAAGTARPAAGCGPASPCGRPTWRRPTCSGVRVPCRTTSACSRPST
jgi:hypothetical protein